jgi:hypothetical protein
MYARNDNGVRINDNVSNAIVLTNTDKGYFYSSTVKLEYPYKKGLWGLFILIQVLMIYCRFYCFGSWTGARSVNGNNDLPLSCQTTIHHID